MKIPGLIDLQVNGFKGVDFSSSDLTKERFVFACRELIKTGTVLFLPTIISSSEKIYQRNLRLISKVIDETDLKKHIPGIHLEGPFISNVEGARGAHQSKWIKNPDLDFLKKLIEWSGEKIKLLTIAAELDKADKLCQYATNSGIKVSLGHQLAEESDLQKLVDSGAALLTHLGNGIPQKIDRHKNPIWPALANDDLTAMIIPDGHHIPDSFIKTVIQTKGALKTIVVSDASPIAGLPPGKYSTLGNEVILEGSGRLYNPKTGYLVGSSATMMDCMNYLRSLDFLSNDELLRIGYFNVVKVLGLDSRKLNNHFQSNLRSRDTGFSIHSKN